MTTVILPLGATEQHGPHLPLGTDSFRAEALAERLASTPLQHTLVAPALPVAVRTSIPVFQSLLSLDHATLAGVIVDYSRPTHGGLGCAPARALSARRQWPGAGDWLRLSEELPGLQVGFLVLRRLCPMLCSPWRKPRVYRPKR